MDRQQIFFNIGVRRKKGFQGVQYVGLSTIRNRYNTLKSIRIGFNRLLCGMSLVTAAYLNRSLNCLRSFLSCGYDKVSGFLPS